MCKSLYSYTNTLSTLNYIWFNICFYVYLLVILSEYVIYKYNTYTI